MRAALSHLRAELGLPGIAALALLAAALAANHWLVRPKEARLALLKAEMAARQDSAKGPARPKTASAKLAAFHEFFRRDEAPVDWLAKLYGSASANGIELRGADYRFAASSGRLEQYRITIPLSATYPRIRGFLEDALAGIPVASLDQVALRRKRAADTQIEAEVSFTLHLPRP